MFKFEKFINYFYSGKQDWKNTLAESLSYKYVKIFLVVLFLANLILWIGAFYLDSLINEDIIALHYNVDFGINLIGSASKIYIIPSLGLFFIITNLIIYFILAKNRDRIFISYILFSGALFVSLILMGGVVSVYLANFY